MEVARDTATMTGHATMLGVAWTGLGSDPRDTDQGPCYTTACGSTQPRERNLEMTSVLDRCPVCGSPGITSYVKEGETEWVKHHEVPIKGKQTRSPSLCMMGGMPWAYALELNVTARARIASRKAFEAKLAIAPARDVPKKASDNPDSPPPADS